LLKSATLKYVAVFSVGNLFLADFSNFFLMIASNTIIIKIFSKLFNFPFATLNLFIYKLYNSIQIQNKNLSIEYTYE
tara:strand:- start:4097 stop:4327 length:231 start_codon:yes stop_codon:yes gene_type:complete